MNTTPNSAAANPSSHDEIDIGRLFGMLRDGKKTIFAITTLACAIGVSVALLSTPIYQADALLQVEQKQNGLPALGEVGELFASESSATTEIELIKSRMNLVKTVEKFNLTTTANPVYLPIVGKGLARLLGETISITVSEFTLTNPSILTQGVFIEPVDTEGKLYSLKNKQGETLLMGQVGQRVEKNGITLKVTALNAKPNDQIQLGKISNYQAIESLRARLSVSERGKNSGMLQLTLTGENPPLTKALLDDIAQNYFFQNVARQSEEAEKSLVFLNNNLPQIKTNLDLAEEKLNQYKQENESVDLGLEAKSALDLMVRVEAKLNEMNIQESEISQQYTPKHPVYTSLLNKKQLLLKEKEKLLSQTKALPTTQQEILRLTRDVEVNQQIYLQLLNRVQELQIVKAGTIGNVRIVDHALVKDRPIKPKKALIVVLATLLGGMFSVALVLLRMAFNRGIENPNDVENLGISVLSCVPKSNTQEKTTKIFTHRKNCKTSDVLLSEVNPADLSIEAIRGLRTSLYFALKKAKNNIIMISGPNPEIGKSFISANLANVIVKSDKKVLLIDADLRKGYLQRYFGLEWDQGLSDYLLGKESRETIIKETDIENLHLITRGNITPNPAEMLSNQAFADLLNWASEYYDLVIIDSPPILAVTDPSIIGQYAGTVLMVGRFEKTGIKEIEAAKNAFTKAGIDIHGFILNYIEKRARNSYDSNYGYYSYNYK